MLGQEPFRAIRGISIKRLMFSRFPRNSACSIRDRRYRNPILGESVPEPGMSKSQVFIARIVINFYVKRNSFLKISKYQTEI